MKTASRRGFTIFQLLTALAILALLFSLLLPAIVKVKQSAGRATSINNMKQLGLACHDYHDTYLKFPSGNDPNNYSVAAKLLPYVEQNNVYQQIDFKKPMTDKANAEVRKTRIKLFLSPLDPQAADSSDFGPTNYLFNAGAKPGLADNNGVFWQDSHLSLTEITNADGSSNTLMIGETLRGDGGTKAVDVHRHYVFLKDKDALKNLTADSGVADFKDNKHIVGDRCASWMDGRFLQGTFTGTRVINDERPDVDCDGLGGLSALRSLDGQVSVTFCDGSVRTFRKTVPLEVWKNLCAYNDGNLIPAEYSGN
jgi:hypothetical protein